MQIAYVLLNTETGQNTQLDTLLNDVEGVKEIYAVDGVYDLIIKVEAESMSELRTIIQENIRRLPGIRSSLTLVTFK